MSLSPGIRIGAYEILGALGAGGMGEVYRARDTKLGRDVALKVISQSFTYDPERVARFEREAQLLAALNHPHIAGVYGLEQSDGAQVLAMELVEGGTLADRLTTGPLPVAEALAVARQIADALQAAHDKGIIHRDLKPANIALTADGQVKVLDFGLAKALEPAAAGNVNLSPTLSLAATQAGMILGTAAYMSPEQARGKPADKRSDVWAFGCVLYEMLTGRRAFEGEEAATVLARVLEREPDWTALPEPTPPPVRALVRRCLEKDRRRRVADISTGLVLIDELDGMPAPVASRPPARRPAWRRAVPSAVAALVAAMLAGVTTWVVRPSAPLLVTRSRFTLPAGQELTNTTRQLVALSPDGAQLVYVGDQLLFLRSLSDLEARPIPGTENVLNLPSVNTLNANSTMNPVFSPDGNSIAYYAGGFKRIAVNGGTPVSLAQGEPPWGMSWGDDGIVYGQGAKGIMRLSPNGGAPEVIVSVAANEFAANPQMLSGGRAVLFTVAPVGENPWGKARIVVQSLTSGERNTIIENGSDARYVPTGHIVYAVGGSLFAVPFDERRLEVTGAAAPVVEGIRRSVGNRSGTGSAQYSISNTGSLVYIPGPISGSAAQQDLVLIDRRGGVERLKASTNAYASLRLSPDGRQAAVETDDGREAIVWIHDLSGRVAPRRLTFGGNNRAPIWSADGQRVTFQSDREGDPGIFWQRADGTGAAERLTKPEQGALHVPESWSPKGERLLFSAVTDAGVSLWSWSAQERMASPFGDARSTNPFNAVFSRDGRWVAYTLRSDTLANVYVEPFPATGAKYQITTVNGHHPIWTPDGGGLSYRVGSTEQVFVSVSTQPSFTVGNAEPAMTGELPTALSATSRSYDITPDGSRFLVIAPATTAGAPVSPEIRIVINWFEELKRLVPAN